MFGLAICDIVDQAVPDRDLDVAELWSGVGAVASAATKAGFSACVFDKHLLPGITDTNKCSTTEDILLEAGFRRALNLVLRLRPGGLL